MMPKVSLTRPQAIKLIVIAVALAFFLSTLAVWFNSERDPYSGGTSPGDQVPDDMASLLGAGKVALQIDSYSPLLRISRISGENREYLNTLAREGAVVHVEDTAPYAKISLSGGEHALDVARGLMRNDPEAELLLEAYVHSDEAFSFSTQQGAVSAPIPRSRINVAYPHDVGETLFFDAIVQLVGGKVVGARLNPLAAEVQLALPVLPKSFDDEYYARLFFNWRDRAALEEGKLEMAGLLSEMGADDIQVNYVTDHTVYADRMLTSAEGAALDALLPGIKAIQFERIIIYSNYTYTEEEVNGAVQNATNGTVTLTFSPPLIELMFNYNGTYGQVSDAFGSFSYTPIRSEIYRKGTASTGGTAVKDGVSYAIPEQELELMLPSGSKVGFPATVDVKVSVVGSNVVEVVQDLDIKFST